MRDSRPILALTGLAGCGKSTAAEHLAREHGLVRVRFAGPLKAMLRAFLREAGVRSAEIERMIEGDRKEAPAPELASRSPRYVMQTLGTEFGRDLVHPELWTRAWTARVRAELADGAPGIVVEDCRFANEAEAVRALGGRIVRIERPGLARLAGTHPSEAGVVMPDLTLANDGTPGQLGAHLDAVLDRYHTLAA